MEYTDGDVYKGTVKNDIFHGKGEYTWGNRDRYVGVSTHLQSIPSTHSLNLHSKSIFSTHPLKTPTQQNPSSHPLVTFSCRILSFHPHNPLSQSAHSSNPHTPLSIHQCNHTHPPPPLNSPICPPPRPSFHT